MSTFKKDNEKLKWFKYHYFLRQRGKTQGAVIQTQFISMFKKDVVAEASTTVSRVPSQRKVKELSFF